MGVEFDKLPFCDRPDLTPYLIHFTKNTINEDEYSAYNNLVHILQTGEIWGSKSSKGFIKGTNSATCFMDVPFNSLKYVFNEINSNPIKPRYEPYGIFISKQIAYENGVRPVLYLSNDEIKILNIPDDELWRVVRLEANNTDWISWLHEREWRCKGNYQLPKKKRLYSLSNGAVGVLVKNYSDFKKLQRELDNNPKKFKVHINSIIPLDVVCQGLYI